MALAGICLAQAVHTLYNLQHNIIAQCEHSNLLLFLCFIFFFGSEKYPGRNAAEPHVLWGAPLLVSPVFDTHLSSVGLLLTQRLG